MLERKKAKKSFFSKNTVSPMQILSNYNPVGNYMFKVNNRNTGTRCEICSKLTIKKIPE